MSADLFGLFTPWIQLHLSGQETLCCWGHSFKQCWSLSQTWAKYVFKVSFVGVVSSSFILRLQSVFVVVCQELGGRLRLLACRVLGRLEALEGCGGRGGPWAQTVEQRSDLELQGW